MQKHEQWLTHAEEDLLAARVLCDSSYQLGGAVLFHSQQCAEKSLKAFLTAKGQLFRKSHDLVELINSCAELDVEFLNLTDCAAELTPFATESRYPDNYLPFPYTLTVENSIGYATKILTLVKEKI